MHGPCQQEGDGLLIAVQSQAYSIDTSSNGAFDPFDLGVLLGKWGPDGAVQSCSPGNRGDSRKFALLVIRAQNELPWAYDSRTQTKL